jgi:hypothetical protein
MRTTIDLPDSLLRELKARAALEGTTLKALVQCLVQQGLTAPSALTRAPQRSTLPSLTIGRPLPLQNPTNAGLMDLLDDA